MCQSEVRRVTCRRCLAAREKEKVNFAGSVGSEVLGRRIRDCLSTACSV